MGRKPKREGIHVYTWLIHFVVQQKLTQQCKAIILQFKKNHCSTIDNSQDIEATYREGDDNPLQHSCLQNPMDGGAWWAAVHGVAKGQTGLRDFTFTFHFHALEKEMATHSSVLAWRIPGTEEPSGLPSLGSHRVGHD